MTANTIIITGGVPGAPGAISVDAPVGGQRYSRVNSGWELEPSQMDFLQTGALASWSAWMVDASAARTRTLPASPLDGDEVYVVMDAGDWSVNNATVGRNGNTIMGLAEDITLDTGRSAGFKYRLSATDWRLI